MLKRQSDKIDFLNRVPLFQGMPKKALTSLARVCEEFEVESGEVLIFQDDIGQAAYVLVTAKALVRRNSRKVAELGPGDVVGELALLSSSQRNATVVATSRGTVLEIHRRHFIALLDESPPLARRVMAQLAERLQLADRKLYG